MTITLGIRDLLAAVLVAVVFGVCLWWPTDGLPLPFVPEPGKRTVTILEETEDRTPKFAAFAVTLRNHQISKEHDVRGPLDDDLSSEIVTRVKGLTPERPGVVIEAGDKVTYAGKCPDEVEALAQLIREN